MGEGKDTSELGMEEQSWELSETQDSGTSSSSGVDTDCDHLILSEPEQVSHPRQGRV